jgi:serine/threonine-protein kinase
MSVLQKRERFGRYLILDHLVDGGMAKICRARFLGGESVDKVVAIKMVQAQHSKDEAFKTMFMDEIKVTFGLLHPNVIQTYDYGLNRGQLFVAMEYCDGRNLKEFLEKLKERKFVFPVEISTYIISQACQGLYYAHTFRDKLTGKEANIIHRDISPHNIMLTYDGAVKIIDFGIAKSQTNSEATQAGTIKGKLSYLAPEYLEGLELDPRYDQFALGITLWEMLCSRKLFKENNDLAVLKKIQECKIVAPSSINPNVPKELDEIVLKALSKDRSKRFDNLDQMNRALMKFLYARFPDFNSTDLSYFSQELFRDEIKKDREKMYEFGRIDLKPYLEDVKKELESGTRKGDIETAIEVAVAVAQATSNNHHDSQDQKAKAKEQVLDFGFEAAKAKGRPTLTTKKSGPSPVSTPIVSKDKMMTSPSTTLPTEGNSNAQIQKSGATKPNIEKSEGTKTRANITRNQLEEPQKKSSLGIIAAAAAIVVVGVYFLYSQKIKNETAKVEVAPKVNAVAKDRQPAQASTIKDLEAQVEQSQGNIVLAHYDKQKMQVFINGKKAEVDLLTNVKVPLASSFILRVQIEGRKHFIKELRVDNSSAVEVEIPEMPAIAYGYINTASDCAQGELRFELYGEKRSSPIPMVETFGVGLPLALDSKGTLIPVTYQLYFKKKGDDVERKVEITISREDQTIDLCEHF